MSSMNIDQRLLKGPAFYKAMHHYVIDLKTQELNSYPRPDPHNKNRAIVNAVNINKLRSTPMVHLASHERMCDRCNTRYSVDSRGMAIIQAEDTCCYHWGRSFQDHQKKISHPFTCCGKPSGAKGCTVSKWHRTNSENLTNLDGYVQTKEKPPLPGGDYGVYALDCEMCITSVGNELACITVVSSDCKIVYQTMVKPDNPILDYNTRFSGITENDFKNVTTTLKDVQTFLLNLLSNKTILIGHGLDGDLRALKLIHDTVVDTSVVFPHVRGPPYKKALKKLVLDILGKDIQKDGVGGHSSKEDAIACMELMICKVNKPSLR